MLHCSNSPIARLLDHDGAKLPLFWCVVDDSLADDCFSLNSSLASTLGLFGRNKYILQALRTMSGIVPLHQVVAQLTNPHKDLKLVRDNFEYFQNELLSQLRLVHRAWPIPLFHKFSPGGIVWITIDQFNGAHKEHAQFGIIKQDTEFVIDYDLSTPNSSPFNELTLTVVPHRCGLDFKISPIYSLSGISAIFHNNQYKATVQFAADGTVPEGYLAVPEFALDHALQLDAKSIVRLRPVHKSDTVMTSMQILSSSESYVSDLEIGRISLQRPDETLIMLSSETILQRIESDGLNNIKRVLKPPLGPPSSPSVFNFDAFIRSNHQRIMLLEGYSGSGKTQHIKSFKYWLNHGFSSRRLIYYDCLGNFDLKNINPAHHHSHDLIVLDHFDEAINSLPDSGSENENTKYCLYRELILSLIQGSKVILVVRSARDLGNIYLSSAPLPVDVVYTHQPTTSSPSFKNLDKAAVIHGQTSVIDSLKRYLLHPLKYHRLYAVNGMKTSAGTLLIGPSGSGKTFVAEAFLRSNRVRHIIVRGPEILDKYVGESEKAVRELFSRARSMRPCVLFFDELDSLTPMRGSGQAGVTDRIVNQFLTEIDGTEDRSGVFILATTSRPDLIDAAIVRPGRIDKHVHMESPHPPDIEKYFLQFIEDPDMIINMCTSLSEHVSWSEIAALAKGMPPPLNREHCPPKREHLPRSSARLSLK